MRGSGAPPLPDDEHNNVTPPFEPRTVLVTGVAGFLGSNLLDRLMADGHTVIGIDNLSMGRRDNVAHHMGDPRFQLLERDCTRDDAYDGIEGVDVVVHLAAFKIPRYGKAIDTLHVNYRGSDEVLKFAARTGCKVVLASTSDVYGKNPDVPFSEESVSVIGSSKVPRWAYAVSKLFDEHLALAYMESYGFPVVLLRFFGSYGPRQHLTWWGGPQSVFIAAAMEDRVIPIHGDGLQTRSFTFVTDTVEGIYQATMRESADGEIINIGNDHEITIKELAERIWGLVRPGEQPKIEFTPYDEIQKGKRYEDVMRRVPVTTKAQELLGVKAEIDIDEGLARTIAWQKEVTPLRAAEVVDEESPDSKTPHPEHPHT
jgi:UDP-glucose 4-epimerase